MFAQLEHDSLQTSGHSSAMRLPSLHFRFSFCGPREAISAQEVILPLNSNGSGLFSQSPRGMVGVTVGLGVAHSASQTAGHSRNSLRPSRHFLDRFCGPSAAISWHEVTLPLYSKALGLSSHGPRLQVWGLQGPQISGNSSPATVLQALASEKPSFDCSQSMRAPQEY